MAAIDDDPDLKALLGQKSAQSAAPDSPAAQGAPGYLNSTSATPPAAPLTATDYLLQHLSQPSQSWLGQHAPSIQNALDWAAGKSMQMNRPVNDFGATMLDRATYGFGDTAPAYVAGKLGVQGGQTLDQIRQGTQQSRANIGPYAGFAADVLGAAPSAAYAGAAMPINAGTLALQGAGSSVLEGVGHGDFDPWSLAKKAATGGVLGFGTGVVAAPLSKLAQNVVTRLGVGSVSPEEAIARTQANVDAATDPLKSMMYTPPARGSADAARYGVHIPSATEGGGNLPGVFQPGPNPNSSAADIFANLMYLRGLKPEQDVTGGGAAVAQRLERNLTERAPIGGTPGAAQSQVAAATAAQAPAAAAQKLQGFTEPWAENVRPQAAAAANAAPVGSPERAAWGNIASAPTGAGQPPWWYRYIAQPAISAGSAAGVGAVFPTAGHIAGAFGGNVLGEAGARLFTPGSASQLQDAIARNYPALTGQFIPQTRGLQAEDALSKAMQTLMFSQSGKTPPAPSQLGIPRPPNYPAQWPY